MFKELIGAVFPSVGLAFARRDIERLTARGAEENRVLQAKAAMLDPLWRCGRHAEAGQIALRLRAAVASGVLNESPLFAAVVGALALYHKDVGDIDQGRKYARMVLRRPEVNADDGHFAALLAREFPDLFTGDGHSVRRAA